MITRADVESWLHHQTRHERDCAGIRPDKDAPCSCGRDAFVAAAKALLGDGVAHDRRVTELLQHNNELLQRARDAEKKAAHVFARPMRSVATAFQPLLYVIGCVAVATAIFAKDSPCGTLPTGDRLAITAAWPITLFLISVTNHVKPHTSICDRVVEWRRSP